MRSISIGLRSDRSRACFCRFSALLFLSAIHSLSSTLTHFFQDKLRTAFRDSGSINIYDSL